MQKSTNGNGYNGAPRGQQGRPEIKAREKTGEDRVREILEEHKEEITALFATDEKPAAMYVRACALSVSAYRKIQKDAEDSAASQNKPAPRINEESAVATCLFAMQRKLDPGTDVYLVPYGQKVTPILSPQGVIKLIMRSGYVKAVQPPRTVFEGEYFDYMLGSEQWVKHKKANMRPLAVKDNRGQVAANKAAWEAISHVYCVIDLKEGGQVIEVHDRADVEYYRSLSPTATSNYSGWAKFPAEFARKACLKQAAKWIPQESEVSVLLAADESERGIEIPDELFRAVGARFMREMVEEGAAATKPDPAPPPGAPPEPAKPAEPAAGDATQWYLPGKPGTMPTVAKATDEQLVEADGKLLKGLDAGEFSPGGRYAAHRVYYMSLMLTIRETMRGRGIAFPAHPAIGEGYTPAAAAGGGNGELTAEEEDHAFADSNAAAAAATY